MDELRERIKMLLAHFSINQTEFAEKIGISKGMMSHIMSPTGRQSSFTEDKFNRIIEVFPSVNRDWLINGIGNMLNNDSQHSIAFQPSFEFYDATDNAQANNVLEESGNYSTSKTVPDNIESNASKTKVVKKPHKTVVPKNTSDNQHSNVQHNMTDDVQVSRHPSKSISRIVIFYTDGTFAEYKPGDNRY